MSRFRLFMLAMASFLAVVGESFFKKSIAVGLCGILTFNSASCWGNGVSAAIANQGELSLDRTEIAIPPRIREASVNLEGALADDFGIVSQNPFSSGRNEILFTSPSTGVEQKYSVNLPGKGDFQLFEVEFNKVSVPNPEKLVGEGNSVFTADQIANLLQNFRINFQNNLPSEVIFADGSKAEFSNSSYVFKLPSGEVVDSVTLSQGNLPDGNGIASKARIINSKYGSYNYLVQSGNACQSTVRTEINSLSKDLSGIGDILKSIDASTKELARWTLAFGSQALEDSTVVTGNSSREENIDAAYCRLPVECGQVQNYEGGSEIRTNLFHLQPGTNRTVNLDYEFYQVPDRLEIYYNGEIRYAIPEPTETLVDTKNPPPGFLTNGNGRKTLSIDDGVEYVGVKVIGNYEIKTTKWNYQISCSGEAIADAGTQCSTDNSLSSLPNSIKSKFSSLIKQNVQGNPDMCLAGETTILGIDRWWTTLGNEIDINLDIHIHKTNRQEKYLLGIKINKSYIADRQKKESWEFKKKATFTVLNSFTKIPIDDNYPKIINNISKIDLGELKPGDYTIKISNFQAPNNPSIEQVDFKLSSAEYNPTVSGRYKSPWEQAKLTTLFVADNPEPSIENWQKQKLIEDYAPILYFDNGNKPKNKNGYITNSKDIINPEKYLFPVSVSTTYEQLDNKNIYEAIYNEELKIPVRGDINHSIEIDSSPQNSITTNNKVIYASIVQNKNNELAINYYFHYPNSNWAEHGGHNDHDGDWEGITVFLDSSRNPIKVAYSQHVIVENGEVQNSSGGQVIPWNFVDKKGTHPKVYVGLGGHASYPFPGLTGWAHIWILFTKPNIEFHKGDLTHFEPTNLQVKYIPHVANLNLKHEYSWLLYPGKWGINGKTPARGPIFQSPIYQKHAEGLRWLYPWQWSDKLDNFTPGINNHSILVNQNIYLGTEKSETISIPSLIDNDKLKLKEQRSIFRGGIGNDIYVIYNINSFIEDTGGENELKIVDKDEVEVYIFYVDRDKNNLIIDINKDNILNYLDDLVIVDFFDDSAIDGKGKGFIKQVGQLEGKDILEHIQEINIK